MLTRYSWWAAVVATSLAGTTFHIHHDAKRLAIALAVGLGVFCAATAVPVLVHNKRSHDTGPPSTASHFDRHPR